MPDNSFTALCMLVDRSGSMQSIRADAEGGVNAFVESRRSALQPGQRMTLRLVEFDDRIDVVCPSTPIQEVKPYVLVPRGMTALLDAMAGQLEAFNAELEALPQAEYPGSIVFAVYTDGYENASSPANTLSLVKERVGMYRGRGWNIAYLGANQDAIKVGESLGVAAGSSLSYTASSVGTRSAHRAFDNYVAMASAAPGGQSASFSDEDREAAEQE